MDFNTMFTCEKQTQWSSRSHWMEVIEQQLNIAEESHAHGKNEERKQYEPPSSNGNEERRKRLLEDGYVLVDQVMDMSLTAKLKNAITALHKQGYPATFVLLYDETWEFASVALETTLSKTTNCCNQFNFDVLAWYVDPREHAAGFSPHRDRQPDDDVRSSFHSDGQAKYVTMWTALSNATPENSCLYVIPRQCDPGYDEGDSDGVTTDKDAMEDKHKDDPLWRALPQKESFQNIRALPRQPGQSILFTHRILHWGSRGNPRALSSYAEPRVAISIVCSDPSFEKPYLALTSSSSSSSLISPPFASRLLLVCAQLLIYHQRFNLGKECIKTCYQYCKEHEDELDPAYRQKVYVEFINAMKEAGKNASIPTSSSNDNVQDSNDDGEADDAVLEAMLDAEQGGYGEFQDDFDDMNGEALRNDENDTDGDSENDDEEDAAPFLFGKRPLGGGGGALDCSGNEKKPKTTENS